MLGVTWRMTITAEGSEGMSLEVILDMERAGECATVNKIALQKLKKFRRVHPAQALFKVFGTPGQENKTAV